MECRSRGTLVIPTQQPQQYGKHGPPKKLSANVKVNGCVPTESSVQAELVILQVVSVRITIVGWQRRYLILALTMVGSKSVPMAATMGIAASDTKPGGTAPVGVLPTTLVQRIISKTSPVATLGVATMHPAYAQAAGVVIMDLCTRAQTVMGMALQTTAALIGMAIGEHSCRAETVPPHGPMIPKTPALQPMGLANVLLVGAQVLWTSTTMWIVTGMACQTTPATTYMALEEPY